MRTAGRRSRLRGAALLVVVAGGAVAALILDLPSAAQVRGWLDGGGPHAWALLVAGLAMVLLTPVPRSLLSVLVGGVIGFAPGLAVALAGGLLGAAAAFGLSRVLGRPALARLAGSRLARADRLFTERGFVSVLVGRLLPVMPFAAVSYGAGLSSIRLWPFLAATAVGLVPGTVVQVGIGASTGFVVAQAGAVAAVPLAVALLVIGGGRAWWYRRSVRPGGAA